MIIGAITGLVPLVSGLIVFFDPLRRKSRASEFLLVASLNALPEDGFAIGQGHARVVTAIGREIEMVHEGAWAAAGVKRGARSVEREA